MCLRCCLLPARHENSSTFIIGECASVFRLFSLIGCFTTSQNLPTAEYSFEWRTYCEHAVLFSNITNVWNFSRLKNMNYLSVFVQCVQADHNHNTERKKITHA